MATGGFKSSAATDFLEEWKAKREKMRAKMLGDIAAATGTPLGASNTNSSRNAVPPPSPPPLPSATEFTNNGNPDRSSSAGNCHPSSYAVARSSSGTSLKRPEEEMHHPVTPSATPGSNLKKALPQPEKTQDSTPMACNDSDKESPSPSSKEKKSTGPSARKGKGQIEKRKLREKRRSTGVVNIPSNEVSRGEKRAAIHLSIRMGMKVWGPFGDWSCFFSIGNKSIPKKVLVKVSLLYVEIGGCLMLVHFYFL